MFRIEKTPTGWAVLRIIPFGGEYYFAKVELIANDLAWWEVGQYFGG